MIVLDTNVISTFLAPIPDPMPLAWLDRQESTELYTTAITACELRAGAARLPRGTRRTQLRESIDRQLAALGARILPLGAECAHHYAHVHAVRRSIGRPISDLDAQIAAIALHHDATLATRNTKDFEGLGLTVVNPWTAEPSR